MSVTQDDFEQWLKTPEKITEEEALEAISSKCEWMIKQLQKSHMFLNLSLTI